LLFKMFGCVAVVYKRETISLNKILLLT